MCQVTIGDSWVPPFFGVELSGTATHHPLGAFRTQWYLGKTPSGQVGEGKATATFNTTTFGILDASWRAGRNRTKTSRFGGKQFFYINWSRQYPELNISLKTSKLSKPLQWKMRLLKHVETLEDYIIGVGNSITGYHCVTMYTDRQMVLWLTWWCCTHGGFRIMLLQPLMKFTPWFFTQPLKQCREWNIWDISFTRVGWCGKRPGVDFWWPWWCVWTSRSEEIC